METRRMMKQKNLRPENVVNRKVWRKASENQLTV